MSEDNLAWKQGTVASGDVTIATGVSGKKFKIYRAIVPISAALNFYFKSGSTQIGPTFYGAASTTIILKEEELGFLTNAGEDLKLTFSAGAGKFVVKYESV